MVRLARSSNAKKNTLVQNAKHFLTAKQMGVVLVIVAAISISLHKNSYQAVQDSQALLFDMLAPLTTGTTTDTTKNAGDVPVKIDKPLNIVIMYGDDWRHDAIGIAGTQPVETPFLDWMATNVGLRFTHNCVSTSICWISRATLHTGQYMSRHKATDPGSEGWYDGFENAFPALLQKAGYHVMHVGKWHTWNSGRIQKFYSRFKEYYGRHWYPGNPTPVHATERNEKDALQFLKERPKDQPFHLTVAFFAPHSWDGQAGQFFPQNNTMKVYENINLTAPANMDESWNRMPQFFTSRNEARHRWTQRFNEPLKYDLMLKNYYRLITGVDAACQSVWNELEAQGILNETMFIFTTDNGYFHGEHGLAGKWYPHEESLRVPLIMYDPRMPPNKRGTTDDSFTLNVDLAPTILGAANVTAPAVMQGRDISELYLTHTAADDWRTEFFYEHPVHLHKEVIPASTALVRKHIKYIHWPDWDTEQIFNLTNDPHEEQDEILNPAYAQVHTELKARHDALREWVK